MWTYYGSKSKIADCYPSPKCDKIIEPFAGSARYSLKHFEKEILLVDKYDVIVKLWRWLQNCSVADIMNLPKLRKGDDIRDLNISEEERMFLGMISGVASTSPRNKVSQFAAEQNGRKNQYKRIADQLYKIKHWEIRLGSYEEIENQNATWFIDPPYQFGGHAYKHHKIDFKHLKIWSEERLGQVMVCENTKADWMEFKAISKLHGASAMSTTTEAMWCNEKTVYDYEQLKMFDAA